MGDFGTFNVKGFSKFLCLSCTTRESHARGVYCRARANNLFPRTHLNFRIYWGKLNSKFRYRFCKINGSFGARSVLCRGCCCIKTDILSYIGATSNVLQEDRKQYDCNYFGVSTLVITHNTVYTITQQKGEKRWSDR